MPHTNEELLEACEDARRALKLLAESDEVTETLDTYLTRCLRNALATLDTVLDPD